MTYETHEISTEDGSPVEIYSFSFGNQFYRFTSASEAQVVDGDTYIPASISRKDIPLGSEDRGEYLEVVLPSRHAIVQQYVNIVPAQKVTLTIRRRHRFDVDEQWIVVFKGVVRSAAFTLDGHAAKLAVMPLSGAFSRQIPRFMFSALCNNVLYDSLCGVDKESFKHTGEVTASTGNELTVDGLDGEDDGWAAGGYVEFGADYRLVLEHTGAVVRLLLPFATDPMGSEVKVYAGCNHSVIDPGGCPKFNNVPNFGGYAWVPITNPFETGVA